MILIAATLLGWVTGCERKGSGAPSDRLDRGSFHVDIHESLDGEPTELNIAELLLTRALLHHGFHRAPADEARYHIDGLLACTYFQNLTMNISGVEQHLEHQWEATFLLTITDRGDGFVGGEPSVEPVVETHEFPEPLRNGRIDAEMAKRDIRRRSATIMVEDITSGALLGNSEVRGLLDAWQDPYDPRSFNDIELALIAIGRPAVPYLLAALADERAVRPAGHYPGLDELNREELRVYHLADRVLSEILQRERGLDLLSTEDLRLRVITGWTWAWEDAQEIPEEFRVAPEARRTSVPSSP